MVFPALFSRAKWHPTDKAQARTVTATEGFKHLLKYASALDAGGWPTYRFASHPCFPHYIQKMMELYRLLTQATVYLAHSESDAALTLDELKATLQAGGDGANRILQCMYQYAANITGSGPYWYARQQELQAVFSTKGCATFFFTLTCADNHWEDLSHLMPESGVL